MEGIWNSLQALAVDYGLRVLGSIAIFIIGRWLARVVVDGLKKLLEKSKVDQTLVSFLGNVLYYLLLVVVIIVLFNFRTLPEALLGISIDALSDSTVTIESSA